MTPSVSTSGRPGLLAACCVPVLGQVVGLVVEPAAVDHADPRAGEDAYGVGVVVAAGSRLCVDRAALQLRASSRLNAIVSEGLGDIGTHD
jgi:hypothetical protein